MRSIDHLCPFHSVLKYRRGCINTNHVFQSPTSHYIAQCSLCLYTIMLYAIGKIYFMRFMIRIFNLSRFGDSHFRHTTMIMWADGPSLVLISKTMIDSSRFCSVYQIRTMTIAWRLSKNLVLLVEETGSKKTTPKNKQNKTNNSDNYL